MLSFRLQAAVAAIVGIASVSGASAFAQQPGGPTPLTGGWQDGFVLQSPNGDHRLVLGMIGQTDGRFSLDDPKPIVNTFTIRKLRPTFSGRVARYFDFKFMPDFGNGAAVVQDAYLDVRFSPRFRVRSGKDKTPIGYELLIGDAFLLFPERALASSLVPNRDIGIQIQGDLSPKLFYAGGLFNGVPDGSSTTTEVDANNGKDLAGRIVLQPFRSATAPTNALGGVGVQVGGSYGEQVGALPSFRTSVGQTYFSYAAGVAADGTRHRVSPALFYYYKAFGAFGEYMRSSQQVARGATRVDVTNSAWELTGSIVLTGESTSDRGVRPRADFNPSAGQWGALQIAGRYSALIVDRDLFGLELASANSSRLTRSFAVGLNWYPNPYIKYYATFERTTFTTEADTREPENVILVRIQLAF
jgi:phosphate-selective porin OprO/OprP